MKVKTKIIVSISVFIKICIYVVIALLIRGERVSDFTEAEHVERISERVEARYIDGDEYTDFSVYPLYDSNDNFTYFCLVELKPKGYFYVEILDIYPPRRIITGENMYFRCQLDNRAEWIRIRMSDKDGEMPEPFASGKLVKYMHTKTKIMYVEADNDGKAIYQKESHFVVGGVETEKHYLLEVKVGQRYSFIPAVRCGDKFLNLISMEEFVYTDDLSTDDIPSTLFYGMACLW